MNQNCQGEKNYDEDNIILTYLLSYPSHQRIYEKSKEHIDASDDS